MKKSTRMKKWFAWIGMLCAIALFFASAAASILFYEMNIYDYSETEYRKMFYEEVADQYSIRALADFAAGKAENSMGDGTSSGFTSNKNMEKELLLEQNFHYGIIKAETVDKIDLTDETIYENWNGNFPDEVNTSQLHVCSRNVWRDSVYSYIETLLYPRRKVSVDLNSLMSGQPEKVKINSVVYNAADGVFYYNTTVGFFPAQRLWMDIEWEKLGAEIVCEFQYDFVKRQYKNLNPISITDTIGLNKEMESDLVEIMTAEIPVQEYPSLRGLENMYVNGIDWIQIVLDDAMGFHSSKEFDVINDDSFYTKMRTETEYHLSMSSADDLWIEYVPEEISYCIVSMLPEEAGFGLGGGMFQQANTFVTIAYGLRYSIYLIMIGLLGLIIWSFGYLVSKAGCVDGTDEIIITGFNKIPLELHFAIVLLIEVLICRVNAALADRVAYYPIPCIWFISVFVLGICIIAIRFLLDLAARIKKGAWWRNTLTYRGIGMIKTGLELCVYHFSLLWKVFLGVTALSLLDLICTYGFFSRSRLYIYGKKVVIAAVIFWIALQVDRLRKGGEKLAAGDLQYQVNTTRMFPEFRKHGENLNSIRDGISHAVEERMKSERFKTELITNVSHDIKTPLTSIINYVDLLEKEELQNETAEEYLEVLERQSARLKKLIEDLIEASKASTGNLSLNLEELDAGVFLVQTVGEFEEKLLDQNLELRMAKPDEPARIIADSRHLWRVIDNLMNNICKYAQPHTRVYINIEETESKVMLIFRNTSYCELNIKSDELMERFVRGDSSRNTEGNGLGLSIAQSLVELMGGKFELQIDGDLFKVVITFEKSVKI